MLKQKSPRNREKGTLLVNTVMLYILTFSNQILSLVAVPYETRILGPEVFGILGVATSIMVYFQLVIDFGFLLSGTQEVALCRDNPKQLSRIFTAVTCCKLALSAISACALFALCRILPAWRDNLGLYMLFLLGTAANGLNPDYLFRGLEKMSAITIRTVCVKVFFTLGIFVFLKQPQDIWVVPAITAVGNLVALLLSLLYLYRKLQIRFCPVSGSEILRSLKRSSVFFYSRIATTAYSALNTIILDGMTAVGASTGYYTAADRMLSAGKSALTPISDSLYPYMVKHRDFRMVKKVLLILEPPIILFCTCAFIWAEPLCVFLLGPEYAPAGQVLRAMLPVGILILPSYILGFPTMSAMGLSAHANYSVIFGSAIHMVNLLILSLTGNINMLTLGAAVSLAEALILGYRIVIIWRNRQKMQKEHHHGQTS